MKVGSREGVDCENNSEKNMKFGFGWVTKLNIFLVLALEKRKIVENLDEILDRLDNQGDGRLKLKI